ncbi:oligopeptide transporter 4-like [Gossypium australe]|uniref:Oligopeptide transporter 4-like n=1 Tax=Gossypium australe TaxID=47621 RepID=A0A5B6VWE9_9ROSI|nr:oligopeptide transporter 4-like [Gossypium australe]
MAHNGRMLKDYTLPSLEMFRGKITEDPNQHLKQFLQLCDTFKYNGVTNDAIRLRLFPFSLMDNAFSWLDLKAPRYIMTWDELVGKFLQRFFPISKIIQPMREIVTFKQLEGESFHESCEHFKMLIQICPHHGLLEWP